MYRGNYSRVHVSDYPYYGLEYGDSCYCGDNADRLVPALPHECAMPCSGDENETCGSAYRMNAYGPSYRPIEPNTLVFQHETVFDWYEITIDLRLEENTSDEKQNIYGLMVEGATYPNIDSQIPAVYLNTDNTLNICMEIGGETLCQNTNAITPGEWFNLWIEQWCWWDSDANDWSWCSIYALIDGVIQFYWWNPVPITFVNVDGIVGNTYGDEFEAASGDFYDFALYSYDDRAEPSAKLAAAVGDLSAVVNTGAVNFVADK